jgi:hypothetical protein
LNNGNNGQRTKCTKIGADCLAENTPNAPEFICPSPKVLDFNEKRLYWASVVREKRYPFGNVIFLLFDVDLPFGYPVS